MKNDILNYRFQYSLSFPNITMFYRTLEREFSFLKLRLSKNQSALK